MPQHLARALQTAWQVALDFRVGFGLLGSVGLWMLFVGLLPEAWPGALVFQTPGAALYLWDSLHPLVRWFWRLLSGALMLLCVMRLGYILWPAIFGECHSRAKVHLAFVFPGDASTGEGLWARLVSRIIQQGWRLRHISQRSEGLVAEAVRPLWQRLLGAFLPGGAILTMVGSLVFLQGSWTYTSLPLVVGERFSWQAPVPLTITLKELHLGSNLAKGLVPLSAVLLVEDGSESAQILSIRPSIGKRYRGLRISFGGDFPAVRFSAEGEGQSPLALLLMTDDHEQRAVRRVALAEPKEHLFRIAETDLLLRLAPTGGEGSTGEIQLQVLDGRHGQVLAETLVANEETLALNGITVQAVAERALAFTLWHTPGIEAMILGMLCALIGGIAHAKWGGFKATLGLVYDKERESWIAFASVDRGIPSRTCQSLVAAWGRENT